MNNKLTIEQQAKLDALISSASAHRIRGDYASAVKQINEALEIDPDNLALRELAADIKFACGDVDGAIKDYKSLLSENKSNSQLEEKYARAILKQAEKEHQIYMQQNPSAYKPVKSSPMMAAVFSVLPGFGQMYLGEITRGVVLLAIVAFSWFLFSAFAPIVPEHGSTAVRVQQFFNGLNFLNVLFVLIAVSVHLYAAIDAVTKAMRSE